MCFPPNFSPPRCGCFSRTRQCRTMGSIHKRKEAKHWFALFVAACGSAAQGGTPDASRLQRALDAEGTETSRVVGSAMSRTPLGNAPSVASRPVFDSWR